MNENDKNENFKPEEQSDKPYIPQVVVKFHDEVQLPYTDDVEEYLDEIGPWSELKDKYPSIDMSRLFKSVDPDGILALVRRAQEQNDDYRPPNFLTYFIVDYPEGENPNDLVYSLSEWESIEEAYLVPAPAPPPNASDILDFQNYLNPARDGIHASYGWMSAGGNGQDMWLVDMEKGWHLAHPGLPAGITLISPEGGDNREFKGHGAAVLGIITVQDPATNCQCGTGTSCACQGIAPNAIIRLVSEFRTPAPSNPNKADAILAAMNYLITTLPTDYYGSVLLLESQSNLAGVDPDGPFVYSPNTGLAPIEVFSAEFDMIELATTNQIVVIEPAGNALKTGPASYLAPVNLDTLEKRPVGSTSGQRILNPNLTSGPDPEYQHSGAIMVGAATWALEHERTQSPPLPTSMMDMPGGPTPVTAGPPTNFGHRIDCYAWGEYVKTTGDGGDNENNNYTNTFSGTSSASAIIAGVALVVQGIAKEHTLGSNPNGTYSPVEMREILGSIDLATGQSWRRPSPDDEPPYGTKSNNPATDLIGVMPDLKKIIHDKMLLEPDVFLRDFVDGPLGAADTGDPHTGPISSSPDIIVRNSQVVNYEAEFGESSPLRDANGLGEIILNDGSGSDKYVYVRVINRGPALAENVQVTVYWSEVSALPTPSDWIGQEIGTATLDFVPAGKMRVAEIVWQDSVEPIPAEGHYCFVGIIGNERDPAPDPSAITTWDAYYDFIRNNNNSTWCNFNVEDVPPPSGASDDAAGAGQEESEVILPFRANGIEFEDVEMQLEVTAQLPERARIWLEGRQNFMAVLADDLEDAREKGMKRAAIKLNEPHSLRAVPFPKNLREQMKLVAQIPAESRQKSYEVFVRQLYKNEEVGRVTWRLVPQKKNDSNWLSDLWWWLKSRLSSLSRFFVISFIMAILLLIYRFFQKAGRDHRNEE